MADFNLIDWVNSTLGIKNEVSATIITTFIIFLGGGISFAIKNFITDSIRRSRIRRTFKNIIQEVSKTSWIKSRRLEKFQPTVNIIHDLTSTFKTNNVTYLNIAFNQDYSEVFHAHSIRLKFIFPGTYRWTIKCFNEIWALLENIKILERHIIIEYDQFQAKLNQHEISYNEYLEKLRQQNADLMIRIENVNFPVDEHRRVTYFNKRDKIFVDWQKVNNPHAPLNTHNKLIQPLLTLNHKYSDLQDATLQNDILIAAAYQYEQMLATLANYELIFKKYASSYSASAKILDYCLVNI